MYTVVMGVDTSEDRARRQADDVVDLPGAGDGVRVVVVHDFTDNPEGASVQHVASVRRARERLEAAGIDVELKESSGDPAAAIVDAAEEYDADLVNVAARKRSPTGKVVFGSVTQAVLLNTHRPVLVSDGGA
jgi:nucleotide-binding universal stress UspA family protein